MRILGLDPSLTNFGWAVIDTEATGRDRCPARGRFQTSKSKMDFVERNTYMRQALRDIIQELDPDRIGVEFPVFNSDYSEGMYGLFLYTCEALKLEKRDAVFWSPIQVKGHARDSINRPQIDGKRWKMMKADMGEAARNDTGGKGQWNHNEADAYLVARLSSRFWQLYDDELQEVDLTEREQKYFLEVKRYVRGKKAGREVKRGVAYRENERFFLWSEN